MLDKHSIENKNYIAALRVWRNKDHEDNLVMSRHEVIELLREIDTRK